MTSDCYLGMRPGDLDDKPYARHWDPDMAPLRADVAQALLQSPCAASEGLLFSDCGGLLKPGRDTPEVH